MASPQPGTRDFADTLVPGGRDSARSAPRRNRLGFVWCPSWTHFPPPGRVAARSPSAVVDCYGWLVAPGWRPWSSGCSKTVTEPAIGPSPSPTRPRTRADNLARTLATSADNFARTRAKRSFGCHVVPGCLGRSSRPTRRQASHHHPYDPPPRGRSPRRQPVMPQATSDTTSGTTKTSWDGSTSPITSASTARATSTNCAAARLQATLRRTYNTTGHFLVLCEGGTSIKRLCRRPSLTESHSRSRGPPRTFASRATHWRAIGTSLRLLAPVRTCIPTSPQVTSNAELTISWPLEP